MEREDEALRGLLRRSRPEPPLPPGFATAVHRRLQAGKSATSVQGWPAWLDALAEWALKPRWAIAGLAVALVCGSLWGAWDGMAMAKQNARTRYLASVAPYANP